VECEGKEQTVIPRILVLILASAIGLGLPLSGVALGAEEGSKVAVLKRDEDDRPVFVDDDDDDDDDNSGDTDRTGKSHDRTGSRHTRVSRDRDRSRGDLTRDKTRDGKGGKKRDWSRHHTNDRSRNDTR
jgi:hypothetical protein